MRFTMRDIRTEKKALTDNQSSSVRFPVCACIRASSIREFEVDGAGDSHAFGERDGRFRRICIRHDVHGEPVAAGPDRIVDHDVDRVEGPAEAGTEINFDRNVVLGVGPFLAVVRCRPEQGVGALQALVGVVPLIVLPVALHIGKDLPDLDAVNVEFVVARVDYAALRLVVSLHFLMEMDAEAVPAVLADGGRVGFGDRICPTGFVSRLTVSGINGAFPRHTGHIRRVVEVSAERAILSGVVGRVEIVERFVLRVVIGGTPDTGDLHFGKPVPVGERLVPEEGILEPEVVAVEILFGRMEVLAAADLLGTLRDGVGGRRVLGIDDVGNEHVILFERLMADRAFARRVDRLVQERRRVGPLVDLVRGLVDRDYLGRRFDEFAAVFAVIRLKSGRDAGRLLNDRDIGFRLVIKLVDREDGLGDDLAADGAVIGLLTCVGAGRLPVDRVLGGGCVDVRGRTFRGGLRRYRARGGRARGGRGVGLARFASRRKREDDDRKTQDRREGKREFLHIFSPFLIPVSDGVPGGFRPDRGRSGSSSSLASIIHFHKVFRK